MLKIKLTGIILFAVATLAIAQNPVPPALYSSATDIASALEMAAGERAGMAASRIEVSDHYRINLIRRTEAAGAIVHRPGTELHYITDGAGTFGYVAALIGVIGATFIAAGWYARRRWLR